MSINQNCPVVVRSGGGGGGGLMEQISQVSQSLQRTEELKHELDHHRHRIMRQEYEDVHQPPEPQGSYPDDSFDNNQVSAKSLILIGSFYT